MDNGKPSRNPGLLVLFIVIWNTHNSPELYIILLFSIYTSGVACGSRNQCNIN